MIKENAHWPNEVRLKMIEKSVFYPDEEKVYQYGYYDGYQEALSRNKKQINDHDRLVEENKQLQKALKHIVQTQYNKDMSLASLNVAIKDGKKLLI